MKTEQDRHKNYIDIKITTKEYSVGEHVFLRVKPKKSTLSTRLCAKLASIYVGPFKLLTRVGPVAYQLDLPPHIKMNDVFHVSLLKNYIADKYHIIDWNNVQVELEGDFHIEPVQILDRREAKLHKRSMVQVKEQWEHYASEEATWET